jgi:cytochrome P450
MRSPRLLHDPRISSDRRNRTVPDDMIEVAGMPLAFIRLDDPEHERLRDIAMRPFGPPHSASRIDAMHGEITAIAKELIDALQSHDRIDLVDDFAYPLPVTSFAGCSAARGRIAVPRLVRGSDRGLRPHPRQRPGGAPTRRRGSPDGDGEVPGRARR